MFEANEKYATAQDTSDPLRKFRERFLFPKQKSGEPFLYFTGNSLGLQPAKAKEYVIQELDDWARLGVEGHLHARKPWYPYHEFLTESTARLVGAKPSEVVAMNSLTVNLHLMLVSFYRPTRERFKIVIEENAFPSDRYAVASHIKWHNLPASALVEWKSGEPLDKILGKETALVLIGNVNFLSGEAFDVGEITELAHKNGALIGFDFAHGAGNLALGLHEDGPDFAIWCSYKYLNAGPGAIAGCFVHDRHAQSTLPRFEGWWGHDKVNRFRFAADFQPIGGAESWQLSNPPILQLAALRASMEIFDEAGMPAIRKKSETLTGFLEFLVEKSGVPLTQVTPKDRNRRGSQLSFTISGDARGFGQRLKEKGVLCDFREPNILRFAPAPLYNSFDDVYRLSKKMEDAWKSR